MKPNINRRVCLILSPGLSGTAQAATKLKKFAFKIKTKDGNIVGNVLFDAHDVDAAKVKLFKRYCAVKAPGEEPGQWVDKSKNQVRYRRWQCLCRHSDGVPVEGLI
jgi:hypothetical protein